MPNNLDVPDEIAGDPRYDEILRLWVADDSVITLSDMFGADTHQWGMVVADIVMHIARMRLEQEDVPLQETFAAIEDGYSGRMSDHHQIQYTSLVRKH